MTRNALVRVGIGTALLVLAADQTSKWWVLNGLDLPRREDVTLLPVLDFTMVWNRGVTFGLLNGHDAWAAPAIAAVALLIVAALGLWLWRAQTAFTAVCVGAIAGGAVGNVLDRLRHGAVVDFIRAHLGAWSWYVFNVADAAIVCGVLALVVESQWPRRADRSGTAGPAARRSGQSAAAAPCGLPKPPGRG